MVCGVAYESISGIIYGVSKSPQMNIILFGEHAMIFYELS